MNRGLNRRELLGTASLLFSTSAGRGVEDEESPKSKILELLRKAHKKYELAALLGTVWNGDDEIATVALGNSMTDVPATKEMHLRAGGVTLTCVCTLLLRLVDADKVALDDKLSRWYPKLPQSDAVTLRMLANCSSGYPDYVRSEKFVQAVEQAPFRQWRPQELIDIGLSIPLLYKPGTDWNYSHTNYVILGEVLQKITKKPLGELLHHHIFEPLKLENTEYPSNAKMRFPVLHAFSKERGIYEDTTYWNPSWTSHSGRMTSTLGDLSVLARAIGSGSLLSDKSRREQVAPTTVGLGRNRADLYFGLGIILMNGWMVQNPRFGGYNLIFAHLPTKKLSVVVTTTMSPKNSPEVAYSTLVFKELVQLLTPDTLIPPEVK